MSPCAKQVLDVIVTRHESAADMLARHWAARGDSSRLLRLSHVTPAQLALLQEALKRHGKALRFSGVWPLHLAAQVCELGLPCWSLDLQAPAEVRGREWSYAKLAQLKPRLTRYNVCAVESMPLATGPAAAQHAQTEGTR